MNVVSVIAMILGMKIKYFALKNFEKANIVL
jgi:hypothetical protein